MLVFFVVRRLGALICSSPAVNLDRDYGDTDRTEYPWSKSSNWWAGFLLKIVESALDALLAERFDHVLAECDQQRTGRPSLTDGEIQSEVDEVRAKRRQDRYGAAGR